MRTFDPPTVHFKRDVARIGARDELVVRNVIAKTPELRTVVVIAELNAGLSCSLANLIEDLRVPSPVIQRHRREELDSRLKRILSGRKLWPQTSSRRCERPWANQVTHAELSSQINLLLGLTDQIVPA